jgi:hypothetical protein
MFAAEMLPKSDTFIKFNVVVVPSSADDDQRTFAIEAFTATDQDLPNNKHDYSTYMPEIVS